MARPPLAVDKVRFVGEAVAVVLAESLAAATDGAELVDVDLRGARRGGRPASWRASRPRRCSSPTPTSNTAFSQHVGVSEDDALAGADVVVRGYFEHQRLSASPMETNAVLVEPHADGTITLHASAQGVHTVRDAIARVLGLRSDDVRVVAPHVGGGFGAKYHVCNEFFVLAAAARAVGRPVRWIETRTEHLLGSSHGRGQLQHAAMGFTRDGKIVGVAATLLGDGGAYPGLGAVMPNATGVMACGPYRIPRVSVDSMGVVTNTSPTIAYRGAGRPEAAVMLERLIDLAARELGIDPIELRRRNLLEVDDFPYTTPTGLQYDSGDYRRALDIALEAIDYDGVRRRQQSRSTVRAGARRRCRGVHGRDAVSAGHRVRRDRRRGRRRRSASDGVRRHLYARSIARDDLRRVGHPRARHSARAHHADRSRHRARATRHRFGECAIGADRRQRGARGGGRRP